MGQLTNLEDESDCEPAAVLDHLSRRFPHLSQRWLHELARTVHERFRDAPNRTLVPILVERQAAAAVRRTSVAPSAADGSVSPLPPFRGHGRDAEHGRTVLHR